MSIEKIVEYGTPSDPFVRRETNITHTKDKTEIDVKVQLKGTLEYIILEFKKAP